MKIDLENPDIKQIRKQIENKYPQFNLSGYTTDKLLENEKYVDNFGGA